MPVFFCISSSEDDPYLLIAALHAGKEAKFVSNDVMRQHMYKLKDPKVGTNESCQSFCNMYCMYGILPVLNRIAFTINPL